MKTVFETFHCTNYSLFDNPAKKWKRLRAEQLGTSIVQSRSAARHLEGAKRLCAHAQFVHMRMAVAPETTLLATKSCIIYGQEGISVSYSVRRRS